jgi:ABC-2 type transport system permease protein
MHIATSPLIPSGWAVKSLLASTAQRWYEGWIFIFLIWTTCLVLFRILDHVASCILLPILRRQNPYSNRGASGSRSGARFNSSFWWKRPFFACVSKDVLLLVRDPMQWSQALVFFGLLGAYFANIHRVSRLSVEPSWRVGVSSLNLVCTLLVFGSLAVRFLFPQMSLEGRRLWLTHIIPGGFKKLLMAKLVFYSALAVIIVDSLLWISASNLQVSFSMRLWLAGVGAIAAVSLTGLTLGLGAKLIDIKAQDPARLVSSSSGAITLVLMLLYVGVVGFSLVLAWEADARGGVFMFLAAMPAALASFILGYLPVKLGMRSLERIEL